MKLEIRPLIRYLQMPANNKPKAAASSKDDDDMKQVAELIGKLIFLQTHRIMEILILILKILILKS